MLGVSRVLAAGVLSVTCGALVLAAQRPAAPAGKDQKPDPSAQAQAAAQQQEVQALVRTADAAMSGQPAPADFPIQFQHDFLKALGNRVWVPITLTMDPAKVTGAGMSLYLRVVPRGMTSPPGPAPAAADRNAKDKDKDKKKDLKATATALVAPSYPF